MKTKESIQNALREALPELKKKYPIQTLSLFGSYSREEYNSDSDIDILVEFSNPVGIEFIDLADELEELLTAKVDLVSKHGVKQKYLKEIENELVHV
ncbi:nucleotidyltransferase family protein [Gracilimonas sp.]|uniref:nucleotidyltransferase family protein n=1 Tax=Gracilimonas sp. TaxID=1974203 RepID=UPI0028725F01|nr:nucleotidyltransferase family protein [Gracilimonas sp.]